MPEWIANAEGGDSVRGKLNSIPNNGSAFSCVNGDMFGNDQAATTGLTYGIKAGKILFDANADYNPYDAGTVTLFDDTINLLYLCPDFTGLIADAVLVVDSNAPAPFLPVGVWALAAVTTSGGEITNIEDRRVTIFAAFESRGILSDLSFVRAEDNGDGTFAVTMKAGSILSASGVPVDASGRFVTIPGDDGVNYIEIGQDGVISTNTSAFTAGKLRLATVTMQSGAVLNVTDYRCFLYAPSGASGSFVSSDAKTVTVVNGIITDIT